VYQRDGRHRHPVHSVDGPSLRGAGWHQRASIANALREASSSLYLLSGTAIQLKRSMQWLIPESMQNPLNFAMAKQHEAETCSIADCIKSCDTIARHRVTRQGWYWFRSESTPHQCCSSTLTVVPQNMRQPSKKKFFVPSKLFKHRRSSHLHASTHSQTGSRIKTTHVGTENPR